MVSTLDIFEASVDEVLFVQFGEGNGDDLTMSMLMALPLIVEGMTTDYVFRHLAPRLPATVEEDGELMVNHLWSANDTFAPIYACLADYFYQSIAPLDYPEFPTIELESCDDAMFGFRLVTLTDQPDSVDNQEYIALVAGCSALAAHQCVQQPIVIILGYMLAHRRLFPN